MAPTDAIHPVATGRAAETVAQHQDPQDLTFYSGWYKEVDPYKREEHFLRINPKGLVPAVEYRGKAIYESLVLLEFLEDAYPSYKPNLLPSDPYERARQRIWIDHISKTIIPASMRLTMTQPNEQEKFAGEQFTLVDVVIAPWVSRDYVSAEHRGFKREDERDKVQVMYDKYLRGEAQSEAAKAIRAGRPIP